MLTPTLMGLVVLCLTDDKGVKHSFALTNVNYLLELPVNILSLRQLAELYPDKNNHPDRTSTGIHSVFYNHIFFWDREKSKKTFQSASLGLPECFFSSGYSKLSLFLTTISNFYNDTVNSAFTSKDKIIEFTQTEGDDVPIKSDGAIVYAGENKITIDIPVTLSNLISFFDGMKLKYNNGNGTRDTVTFNGADFIDDMQIKCKIKLSNNTIILVDPEMLNFIENPNIASIPQTSEEYCRKCTNIWPEDLQHILSPKSLSPLQEEMVSHHYRLHHTPFPKLIVLAEKGVIPKQLAVLKGPCPICVACLFDQAHKRPWRSKSKQTHPICKPTDDASGKRASADTLVSAQPGLIPQISETLTNL
jgi:hypothetical protein